MVHLFVLFIFEWCIGFYDTSQNQKLFHRFGCEICQSSFSTNTCVNKVEDLSNNFSSASLIHGNHWQKMVLHKYHILRRHTYFSLVFGLHLFENLYYLLRVIWVPIQNENTTRWLTYSWSPKRYCNWKYARWCGNPLEFMAATTFFD